MIQPVGQKFWGEFSQLNPKLRVRLEKRLLPKIFNRVWYKLVLRMPKLRHGYRAGSLPPLYYYGEAALIENGRH